MKQLKRFVSGKRLVVLVMVLLLVPVSVFAFSGGMV